MYTSYYHFNEKPFGLTPNPAYLYLSDSHREALNHLRFGIEQREGFILITGDVGTGKTTLCRTLLSQLKGGYKTAYIFNPILSVKDLLKNILEEFDKTVPPNKTKRDLITDLNKTLLAFYQKGLQSVLIIDEAQNLSIEVLENIRLLSNLETTKHKLLQIILVGQPELEKKLQCHDLRQLNQRITIRYRLSPLSLLETSEYIHHRLIVAGPSCAVRFERSAIKTIHHLSKGIPRLINQLCDRALLVGYVAQKRNITRKMVKKGYQALRPKKPFPFTTLRWAGITAGLLCIIALGVYLKFRPTSNSLFVTKRQAVTLDEHLSQKAPLWGKPQAHLYESPAGGPLRHESH